MRTYLKAVWSHASSGFAVRIDLWYGVAGVLVSGLTGSRERPLGALTPFELARYLLVAVVAWWVFRLILLAPYRLWREQCATIAALEDDLARPARAGTDEIHRLRAAKRLELASEINRLQWMCFNGKSNDDIVDADLYENITGLTSWVNPPRAFFRLIGEQHQICIALRDEPKNVAKQQLAARATRMLTDFLHGECDESDLRAFEEGLKTLEGRYDDVA